MFDQRSLAHSTIMYETLPLSKVAKAPALMRIEWNQKDANYIATFQQDNKAVIILDVRVPAVPVFELNAHQAPVSAVGWAPHSSAHICSSGDDGNVFLWDISQQLPRDALTPIKQFQTGNEVANVSWGSVNTDWIAMTTSTSLQIVPI
jgi:WD repeat-containing protein 68